LERRRSRYPRPQRSPSRIRAAAIAVPGIYGAGIPCMDLSNVAIRWDYTS
jgi:hypothetical protein